MSPALSAATFDGEAMTEEFVNVVLTREGWDIVMARLGAGQPVLGFCLALDDNGELAVALVGPDGNKYVFQRPAEE